MPEDPHEAGHQDVGAGPSGAVASHPRQSLKLWHPTQRDSSCPSRCPLSAQASGRCRGRRGHKPPFSLDGLSGHPRLLLSTCHRDARCAWTSGALRSGSAKCQSAPPRLPREGGSAPSLPHTVLAPSPWAPQPLCVGRLSLGEVPKVPTRNPEGGGPGWSELNFLSI